jgi:hypothetical protein
MLMNRPPLPLRKQVGRPDRPAHQAGRFLRLALPRVAVNADDGAGEGQGGAADAGGAADDQGNGARQVAPGVGTIVEASPSRRRRPVRPIRAGATRPEVDGVLRELRGKKSPAVAASVSPNHGDHSRRDVCSSPTAAWAASTTPREACDRSPPPGGSGSALRPRLAGLVIPPPRLRCSGKVLLSGYSGLLTSGPDYRHSRPRHAPVCNALQIPRWCDKLFSGKRFRAFRRGWTRRFISRVSLVRSQPPLLGNP